MNNRNYISAKPVILIKESKAEILEKEKIRSHQFIKSLQEEAKKIRMLALYEMDSNGRICQKSIQQYKNEFRERKLSDNNFIRIVENKSQSPKKNVFTFEKKCQ